MQFSSAAARPDSGKLFVISAPSGTGKTTISNRLRESGVVQVAISYTTRAPREGEEHGREYFFVDKNAFMQMQTDGAFLEHAEVFGNYYGTSAEWVRRQLKKSANILLEIDVQGALQIKKQMPDTVLIFIRPPSLADLETRLMRRGKDDAATIARRLQCAAAEIAYTERFDYVIINDNLERAFAEIRSVIIGK